MHPRQSYGRVPDLLGNALTTLSPGSPRIQAVRHALKLKGINILGERWCRCHSSPLTLAGTGNRVAHASRRNTFFRIQVPKEAIVPQTSTTLLACDIQEGAARDAYLLPAFHAYELAPAETREGIGALSSQDEAELARVEGELDRGQQELNGLETFRRDYQRDLRNP